MPDVIDAVSEMHRVLGELKRSSEPMDVIAQWDALAAALEVLMDAVPSPHPWRLIRKHQLRRRREYALVCARYMWPDWFDSAVKYGCDPDELRAVAALLGIEDHRPAIRY